MTWPCRRCDRAGQARDTARCRELSCNTNMYLDREEAAPRRSARACAQQHGRGCLRHDRDGATTRSSVFHDTVPSAWPKRSARAVGV